MFANVKKSGKKVTVKDWAVVGKKEWKVFVHAWQDDISASCKNFCAAESWTDSKTGGFFIVAQNSTFAKKQRVKLLLYDW